MTKIVLVSLMAATVIMAGGYNIPEQSMNAAGLATAYVANAHGADAAYYNPANMVFNEGKGSFEIDLTYIHLTATEADGVYASAIPYNIKSEKENFIIPTFHYVSPAVNDFRFGLSLIAPGGLSKNWNDAPATWNGKEFTLQTYEINPTVAYKINDQLSVAVGLRSLYSAGKIIIDASTSPDTSANAKYDMDAKGFHWGYNLALSYKPTEELSLATTYRSNIDMKVDGDATLTYPTAFGGATVNDSASTSTPLPAVLRLATAYTFNEATTVEFVYERNYWSKYSQLDITFANNPALNISSAKNWDDTSTYRLGVTHKYDSAWTVLAGLAYDESPIPEDTLSFDLPGSDGMIYSIGTRYAVSKDIEVGASFAYLDADEISVSQATAITGSFDNTAVYLFTIGMEYKF